MTMKKEIHYHSCLSTPMSPISQPCQTLSSLHAFAYFSTVTHSLSFTHTYSLSLSFQLGLPFNLIPVHSFSLLLHMQRSIHKTVQSRNVFKKSIQLTVCTYMLAIISRSVITITCHKTFENIYITILQCEKEITISLMTLKILLRLH